jgi:hypothetical protein
MYALLLSIVTKHYNIGLLDRKFILYDNYQDVQAGFSQKNNKMVHSLTNGNKQKHHKTVFNITRIKLKHFI